MIAFVSCSKDDSKSSGGSQFFSELDGTEWSWQDSSTEPAGVYGITILFSGEIVNMQVWSMDDVHHVGYYGSYTYADGNGTMSLTEFDTNVRNSATFSVDGDTMTLNFDDATYSLAKVK